ncbi:MAG: hypothetical protein LH613_07820 [Chamaesiphon sp.]|nr:hypothetical protein [Chamaesiphon sp.]
MSVAANKLTITSNFSCAAGDNADGITGAFVSASIVDGMGLEEFKVELSLLIGIVDRLLTPSSVSNNYVKLMTINTLTFSALIWAKNQ